MKRKSILMLLLWSILLFIVSCQKTIDKPIPPFQQSPSAGNSRVQKDKKKVYVSSVDQLYTAVNDPDNAGTEVILAPGVYILNASYPNGGRIELQPDMSLQGKPGDITAVIIDQSLLPASSYTGPTAITGGIRLGKGINTLEWLSLKGGLLSANAFAVVACDLPSTETSVRISNVKITSNGSRIGLDLRNRLAEHAGRKIYAELQNSEISGFVHSLGFGITIFNANDASNAFISLNMRDNYIHGNKIGIITSNSSAANRTVTNSSIEIKSYTDRLEGNGCAIDPTGGVSSAANGFANNNSVVIKMYGSSISNNNPPGVPDLLPVNGALPGAVYAVGGYSSFNGSGGNNKTSNNVLKMEFYGCDISNNNGIDIYAIGAWCNPAALSAGVNNKVAIHLHGRSTNAIVEASPSIPFNPVTTNVAGVFRN